MIPVPVPVLLYPKNPSPVLVLVLLLPCPDPMTYRNLKYSRKSSKMGIKNYNRYRSATLMLRSNISPCLNFTLHKISRL